MKDRERVMRLLVHARDYAQSFSADKRSEERMRRIGRGKPSVLISYFRECTRIEPYFLQMPLCIEHASTQ